MSRLEKLKEQLNACSGPFPYRDLVKLLSGLGYEQVKTGKTGGTRRKFWNPQTGDVIMMHAPHSKEVKAYAVQDVKEHLEKRGLL